VLARIVLLIVGFLQVATAQTFEVASIKLSQLQSSDGEGNGRESIQTSAGGLTMRNVTLKSCIGWAYDVQDFQIAGPLNAERFDVTGKSSAPATVPALRTMLGALLAERFKLAFHRETKDLSSLVLVVAKGGPKLRVSQEDTPGVLQHERAAMVAHHATMPEFIGTLSGPLRMPVIDKTGLTGRYDFTVDLGSYLAAAKSGEQPDMTAIMMSALREQLGLNLELRKESVGILVIDHVEKPSRN